MEEEGVATEKYLMHRGAVALAGASRVRRVSEPSDFGVASPILLAMSAVTAHSQDVLILTLIVSRYLHVAYRIPTKIKRTNHLINPLSTADDAG